MRPRARPSPIAKERIKASLRFRSTTSLASDLKPNQIIAHSLIKKIGKNARKSRAKAAASPGKVGTKPTKNTYFAQKSEVPGKPMVTNTAKTDKTHVSGAEMATPPI
jgi:hypothetical protein